MVVGVNGVGKTTTIGKLAYQFKKAGKNRLFGSSRYIPCCSGGTACHLSERVGVPIVKQKMGLIRLP